jgi:damage-control phosphatase, subfamily I
MRTKDRDVNSYIQIIDSFIDKSDLEKNRAEVIKKELKTYITTRFERNKWVHPEITKFCTDWYREFYRLIDGKDPYLVLKKESNEKAKEILPNLIIQNVRDSLIVGILGNKIDYGACILPDYDLNKMKEDFEDLENIPLQIDDMNIFLEKLHKAKTVAFCVDNHGEVIFDTSILEYIGNKVGKENLFIVGKGGPMLNDVTASELKELGFEKYGQIVSTGSNCFGLHSEDVSQECKDLLKEVDLIVAKGQAYLEFFTEYNFTNVINVLRVKYPIVNLAFGELPLGFNVIMSSEKYARYGRDY